MDHPRIATLLALVGAALAAVFGWASLGAASEAPALALSIQDRFGVWTQGLVLVGVALLLLSFLLAPLPKRGA